MKTDSNRKSLLIILSVALIVVSTTFLISIFARGYQFDLNNGLKLKVTGLLSVTSKPKSASVYVNNLLVTATDDTLNLSPGNYQIKITKNGYFPWEKTIKIEPELVYQIDAQLLRSTIELKALTSDKIINPITSPDGTKILYTIASPSATNKEKGLYLMELTELPLITSRNTERLLIPNSPSLDWSKFSYEFSPNSKQVLAKSQNNTDTYLLSIDQNFNHSNLFDISSRLSEIKKEWQNTEKQIIQNKLEKLPPLLRPFIATESAFFSFNSSEDKILYQASSSAQIPDILLDNQPPIKSNQTQQRLITKDYFYVYDLKEDTNFLIGNTSLNNISWIPYSNHLLFTDNNQIHVVEYDATNYQTIYSDSSPPSILLPTPDGYRLIIFFEKLYSITIKDR